MPMLFYTGGYNFPNTARCWAHLTAIALNVTISTDIPEHRVSGCGQGRGFYFLYTVFPSLRTMMQGHVTLFEAHVIWQFDHVTLMYGLLDCHVTWSCHLV